MHGGAGFGAYVTVSSASLGRASVRYHSKYGSRLRRRLLTGFSATYGLLHWWVRLPPYIPQRACLPALRTPSVSSSVPLLCWSRTRTSTPAASRRRALEARESPPTKATCSGLQALQPCAQNPRFQRSRGPAQPCCRALDCSWPWPWPWPWRSPRCPWRRRRRCLGARQPSFTSTRTRNERIPSISRNAVRSYYCGVCHVPGGMRHGVTGALLYGALFVDWMRG